MDWLSGIVVYVLLWWWVFFMALPFGVKPVGRPGKGHVHSAPSRPMLWRKALATSAIALALWFGVDWLVGSGLFSFREMAAGR